MRVLTRLALRQTTDPKQVEALLLLVVRNIGIMVQPRGAGQQDDHRSFLQSALVLYPPAIGHAVTRVDLSALVACFRTLVQVSRRPRAFVE